MFFVFSRFAAVFRLLVCGRAQDAGLIFLSAIASSVVAFSREEGLDEAGMLSTGEEEEGCGVSVACSRLSDCYCIYQKQQVLFSTS